MSLSDLRMLLYWYCRWKRNPFLSVKLRFFSRVCLLKNQTNKKRGHRSYKEDILDSSEGASEKFIGNFIPDLCDSFAKKIAYLFHTVNSKISVSIQAT